MLNSTHTLLLIIALLGGSVVYATTLVETFKSDIGQNKVEHKRFDKLAEDSLVEHTKIKETLIRIDFAFNYLSNKLNEIDNKITKGQK